MSLKAILVAGSVNLDLVVHASRLPSPGETIHGSGFDIFHGGKGANQAVAAARLGARVEMIALLGQDLFSQRLMAGLEEAGVSVQAVERVPGPSGVALITRAENGENSIIVVPGANGALRCEHIDAHLELVRQAGIVLTQLEVPLETVARLAERAEQANVPLMLDPAPASPLPRSLLERVAWLTPNETEAEILLGDKLVPEEAATRFLEMGVRNVLLKLGAEGALVAGKDCPMERIPAFPVAALDTTAAGDCFNGAFAVALLRGDTPSSAARYAAAAAAISITRAGAQPSLPSAREVEQFLSSPEQGFLGTSRAGNAGGD